MANQSDTKLAVFTVVMTMDSQEDLQRLYTFAACLLRKRSRESPLQHLLRREREFHWQRGVREGTSEVPSLSSGSLLEMRR